MRTRLGKVVRYFLLVVSILGIFFVLKRLYNDLSPLDSLGQTDESCDTRGDFPSVRNGAGMVATGHSTGCAIVLLSTEFTTYVYVHRAGDADSAKSLVFRFYESPESFDDPKIVWTDNSNLQISIPEVGEVTKKLNSMDGVKISYSIGKEDWSHEESLRLARHVDEILLVWLVILTVICALTVRSIQNQKYKTIWMRFDVPKS
jgi:hypothetical protein